MDKIISNILNNSGYEDLKPLKINGKKSDYYAYITWNKQYDRYSISFCDEKLNIRQRIDIGIPEGIFYISVLDDCYYYGNSPLGKGILINSDDEVVKTFIPENYGNKAFLISPLIKKDSYHTETPSYHALGDQGCCIDGQYYVYSFSLNNSHFFISSITNQKKDSPAEYKLLVVDNKGKILFSQQSSFVFVWCCSDGSYYIISYGRDNEFDMFLCFWVTDKLLRTWYENGKLCDYTIVYISHCKWNYQDAFRLHQDWMSNNYCDCTDTKLLIFGKHYLSIVEKPTNYGSVETLFTSELWKRQFDWVEFLNYKYSNNILRIGVDYKRISLCDEEKTNGDVIKEWEKGGAYLLCDMKGFIFAEQKYGGITYIPYNHSLPKKCGVLTEEHNIMVPFVYDNIIGLDEFSMENGAGNETKRLYIALTGTKSNDSLYDRITLYLNEKELISLASCEYNIIDNKYVQLTSNNEQNKPYNVLYHYKGQLIDDEYSHVENSDKLFMENPILEKWLEQMTLLKDSNPGIFEIQKYYDEDKDEQGSYLCCRKNKGLWRLVSDCYNFDKNKKEEERIRQEEEANRILF